MSDILIFMSGILIYMIRFGIFFMIMYGMLFVFSPAAVLWLPFLIYWRPTIDVLLLTSFITYPPCVAIHQTITLQVSLQYSGIRLVTHCSLHLRHEHLISDLLFLSMPFV